MLFVKRDKIANINIDVVKRVLSIGFETVKKGYCPGRL